MSREVYVFTVNPEKELQGKIKDYNGKILIIDSQ